MVVVVIISILAALAIPTVVGQLRDQRVQASAQEVAQFYRNGRMRAMGRGGAVLVRFDNTGSPNGVLEIREAVRGPAANANCDQLPVSSCTMTDWNNPLTSKLVTQFDPLNRTGHQEIFMQATGPAQPPNPAQVEARMDVCFTPLGRAFVRFGQVGNFVPMTGAAQVETARRIAGTQIGLARPTVVLPNGHARAGAPRAP